MRFRSLLSGLLLVGLGIRCAPAVESPQQEAHRLVTEALEHHARGNESQRSELLRRALQMAPDVDAVRWHLGFVRLGDKWVKADGLHRQLETDPRLPAYHRRRSETPLTLEDQLELANWCRSRNLDEQERAHLFQVLRFQPNHLEVRRRLGFAFVNGMWLDRSNLVAAQAARKADRQAIGYWLPRLQKLADALQRGTPRDRQRARARLRSLRDPAAAGAINHAFAGANEQTSLLAVELLDEFPAGEVGIYLSQQAVFSPYATVRRAATECLRSRPEEFFVPELLAMMQTPVTLNEVQWLDRGQIRLVQQFARETIDRRETLVVQGARNPPAGAAIDRKIAASMQNFQTEALNRRIATLLNALTDQQLPAEPATWWSWWNDYNDELVTGEKPQITFRQRETEMPRPTSQFSSGDRRRCECLAAGTTVWTSLGPRPIESLAIGDLVLAQHPVSGELAYKPVLQTTVRPASPLLALRVGGETIQSTAGHAFWVAGEGWKRARQLQLGDLLHSTEGAIRLEESREGEALETYNLVVDEFQNYFIGKGRVLCHDYTARKPVDCTVPGLSPAKERPAP